MNVAPATNVQVAAVAGFVAVLIEHLCTANGIIIPEDVSSALPGVLIIAVAHIWDMSTGGNAKPQISQSQDVAAASTTSPPTS